MLCACSGEQFQFEETAPQSPESLATRDFSAGGRSSRTVNGDWESKLEDAQVDEAESTLKEALSLNYEEARALLGRLEYQRGNYDAALQVFHGIDIRSLSPRMTKAIAERTKPRKTRTKGENVHPGARVMSLHSVSLLLEAIFLKTKSLEELGLLKEAARECKVILDIVESALPNGIPQTIGEDCKLQEVLHRALESLPKLWIKAGFLDEAVTAYRQALIKPWGLDHQRLAAIQKELASILLHGGVESTSITPKSNNTEEAILLLLVLMKKILFREIKWDSEVMDHLSFALSISGQFECLADHMEQAFPGCYNRAERWFFLALCFSAAKQNETALNLLNKVLGCSESRNKTSVPSLILGAKLCSQDPKLAQKGLDFARKAIDFANASHNSKHFIGDCHKFLGLCYSNATRISISDSERVLFQKESLNSLNKAIQIGKDNDPEIRFWLGLEHAKQRNLSAAFSNTMLYSDMVSGSFVRGWKLLALVLSAEQRFKDAETIVDLAIDESGTIDCLELLRLKAVLQICQERPKEAIETYKVMLAIIQAQMEFKNEELNPGRRLEVEAWLDLAKIYSDLKSWSDAQICIDKARVLGFYCPRGWHTTGTMFEAKGQYKEAVVSFSVSLSIEPDYVLSIVSMAKVLMKMGDQNLPTARSFLMNALRLDPTNHDAWLNLGLISKKEGSMSQAADFFQAAYELKMSEPVQAFV